MDAIQGNLPPVTEEVRGVSSVPRLSTNLPPLPQFTLVHSHYLYYRYSEEALRRWIKCKLRFLAQE